jgi:oligo-1,6-glucosidase
MQTTLSGTLYVYQGEELGQRNMPPSFEPSEYKDVETINYWEKASPISHPQPNLTHLTCPNSR